MKFMKIFFSLIIDEVKSRQYYNTVFLNNTYSLYIFITFDDDKFLFFLLRKLLHKQVEIGGFNSIFIIFICLLLYYLEQFLF